VLLDQREEALDKALNELKDQGYEALTRACDVTDAQACEQVFSSLAQQLGSLDILINNAGISHRSLFVDTDPQVVRRVMEVNFFGSVNCTRAALPWLLESKGVIVAISSVAGFAPLMGRTAYSASKHALHGFFESLRSELADRGVRVLMVCPGFTNTALDKRALNGAGQALDSDRRPVGRQLEPEEVARQVLDAIRRNKRLILPSAIAKLSWWVCRFSPRSYERLMVRSQAPEFES